MSLAYKTSVPLSGLAVPLFTLFLAVLFELSLQLTALLQLSLSLGISIVLPTIAVAIGIVANLILEFNVALGLSLPSFNLNFAVAIDFELTLVLGYMATLEGLISAIENASIVAYGWYGSGTALGAALTAALSGAWPDGTAGDQEITAYLFVATVSGPYSADQIASLGLTPPPAPPPTPTDPPPPAGTYPPPQAYETGLAGLTISPPGSGGVQATGTVTVDDSVATGIGAITAINIVEHGSGYATPPTVQVTDTADIVSIAAGAPVVLTLPNALTIPVNSGFGCTIADVDGDPAINGPANAKVLSPTTVALYSDSAFTQSIGGTGPYSGGTVTGGGTGAVATVTMGGGAVTALKSFLDGLPWPTSTGLAGGVFTFKAMLATVFQLMLDLDGNLKARASLLGSVKLGVGFIPPSIDASLELLAKISANLKANLSAKLPDLTVAVAAALDAQINAIADLTAKIGFYLGMGSVTLEVWEYTGPGNQFGASVAAGPGTSGWHDGTPASVPVTAAVFGITNPASAAAFSALFPGA